MAQMAPRDARIPKELVKALTAITLLLFIYMYLGLTRHLGGLSELYISRLPGPEPLLSWKFFHDSEPVLELCLPLW